MILGDPYCRTNVDSRHALYFTHSDCGNLNDNFVACLDRMHVLWKMLAPSSTNLLGCQLVDDEAES